MISVGPSSGLLIIGHGTRDERGIRDFLDVVGQVQALMPDEPVQPGFLEFASPTIAAGVEQLASQGVRQIRAMPLLLFAAKHVHRDIPEILAASRLREPALEIQQLSHLGCRRQVLEMSACRYREATALRANVPPEETALVFVGRGSRDRRAIQEMHHFAELRSRETPVGSAKICFLTGGRPLFQEILPEIARGGARRIVIQPHLLFAGCLVEKIGAQIEAVRPKWSGSDWIVTEPLAPDPVLAETVAMLASTGQHEQNQPGPAVVSEDRLS